MKKQTFTYLLTVACIALLSACGTDQSKLQKKNETIMTATLSPDQESLFFKGTIQPISIQNITSQINGNVNKINFEYGQNVKKGQRLITLTSADIEKQYQEYFTDYIKQKENYFKLQKKFTATTELRKEGIIAENEYRDLKIQFNDAHLTYIQSKDKLTKLLALLEINPEKIFKLDVSDQQKVAASLQIKNNQIKIKAPISGIALHPLKEESESKSESMIRTLSPGTSVKEHDTLLTIGNMKGIKIEINVNEINILALKTGQKVKITSVSLPNLTLDGKITVIGTQANPNSNDGLPTFLVTIVVPKIPKNVEHKVLVGMSAQAQVQINKGSFIKIPLKAVFDKDGKTMVTTIDSKTHKKRNVVVQTGHTTEQDIIILSGINAGDHIVIPHSLT